ncbi:MAG: tRNA pseudouridine(38-40) synthase TruA [Clostridia bacterium]|nr:tRNA pseudouridine(38-40) synthase TruA [Clostridia bacterium]
MRNILITIAYDGRNYHGWQIQKNSLSVQEVFQKNIEKILGHKVDLKGCSRTDSGVHANMYCISLKTNHQIPCQNLIRALNSYLPFDIAAKNCINVPDDFHARYSCKAKEYIYKIYNHPVRDPFLNGLVYHYWYKLDAPSLNDAAQCFVGKHDFTSFCTIDQRDRRNMQRTVKYFNVTKQDNIVTFKVCADGFLYNMVRIMIGTLLRVAQGKFLPEDIPNIINAKDRGKAGPTAQACGLYLNKVFY